jgi:lactoylglutathione lyase
MKKMMGMMAMGLAMKAAAIVPLAIGGLFLLASKALIISKIALVLSLIIALKKLLSQKQGGGGGHHHHDSHHGWQPSSGGGGGGWDRRSLEDDVAAQNLAYRGQIATQQ